MKVTSEKLNKLDCWEYEDLKFLKNRRQQYWRVGWWITLIIFFVSNIFLFIYFLNLPKNNLKYLFGVYFLVALVTFFNVIEGGLDGLYSRIFNYFFRRTNTNSKIENYESYFTPIEKEIEEEAISILSGVEVEARKRIKENRCINYDIRLKRKWQTWYARDLETVKNNCELNSEILKIVNKNLKYIKYDTEKRRYFNEFQDELKNPFSYYTWLERKINSLYGRTSPSAQPLPTTNAKNPELASNFNSAQIKEKSKGSTNSFNKTDEAIKQKINIDQSESKITPDEILAKTLKQNSEVKKSEEHKIIELPEISVFEPHQKLNQLEFDFEHPNITLKTTNDIPKKRNTPKYEPIIKASPEFYQNLAIKKIEIGMKGELLVMEHEWRKLLEEGENPDIRLRHKSVIDGDGFGYDILSFENGEKIYIEVKTTTGSFWSNLFFTQNEFKKMNKYGEQYYLYRICNLRLEKNQGDLFIFSGEKMISSYFDFNSKVYVLTEKQNKI